MATAPNGDADWKPGPILFSWTNALERRSQCNRDPSRRPDTWATRATYILQLVCLHALRALITAGVPVTRLVAFIIWCSSAVLAYSRELRRLLASFFGWQAAKIDRHWRSSNFEALPELRRSHISLGVLLLGGLVVRTVCSLWSVCSLAARRRRALRQQMQAATAYATWHALASEYDALEEHSNRPTAAARQQQQHLYDEQLLIAKTFELEQLRRHGDVDKLMFALRQDLYRNFCNITNRRIHAGRHLLPRPIQAYIATVNSCLDYIADTTVAGVPADVKVKFFQESRHTFGRTALVLSGGGALGSFHLGVVRALLEQGLLPRIIAGSSVGAIVAAIVAVHTNEELQLMYDNMKDFNLSFFANNTTWTALAHLLRTGTLQDIRVLVWRLRNLLADVTFEEAFERTGRMLNVTVTAADTNEPPRMLNYLTAPNVVIWSAVAASSAFPGLFPAQELYAKDVQGCFVRVAMPGVQRRWHDGSLENDLPFQQLSELFNVNHFVVSQTNPHLVPLMTLKKVLPNPLFNLVEAEVKHSFQQAQLYLPKWMPTKWMRLFTQPWEGDVTIVLPWSLYSRNVSKAIHNPSGQDLREANKLGSQAAWERMSAIQGNCAVEMKLDQCLQIVLGATSPGDHRSAATLAAVPVTSPHKGGQLHSLNVPHFTSRGRVPSWQHVPVLPTFSAAVYLHSSDTQLASHGHVRARENAQEGDSPVSVSREGVGAAQTLLDRGLSRRVAAVGSVAHGGKVSQGALASKGSSFESGSVHCVYEQENGSLHPSAGSSDGVGVVESSHVRTSN